jgi:hypothetical protein
MEKYLKYKQLYLNSLKNAQKNILEGGYITEDTDFLNISAFSNNSPNLNTLIDLLKKEKSLIVMIYENTTKIILILSENKKISFLDVTNVNVTKSVNSYNTRIFELFSLVLTQAIIRNFWSQMNTTQLPRVSVQKFLNNLQKKIQEINSNFDMMVYTKSKSKFLTDLKAEAILDKCLTINGKKIDNFKIFKRNDNDTIGLEMDQHRGEFEVEQLQKDAEKELKKIKLREETYLKKLNEDEKKQFKDELKLALHESIQNSNQEKLLAVSQKMEQKINDARQASINRLQQSNSQENRELRAKQRDERIKRDSDKILSTLAEKQKKTNSPTEQNLAKAEAFADTAAGAAKRAEEASKQIDEAIDTFAIGVEQANDNLEMVQNHVTITGEIADNADEILQEIISIRDEILELAERAEKAAQSSSDKAERAEKAAKSSSDSAAILNTQFTKGNRGY